MANISTRIKFFFFISRLPFQSRFSGWPLKIQFFISGLYKIKGFLRNKRTKAEVLEFFSEYDRILKPKNSMSEQSEAEALEFVLWLRLQIEAKINRTAERSETEDRVFSLNSTGDWSQNK